MDNYETLVPRSQKVLARNAQQSLAVDLEFDATAAWQYAIDPSTLKFNSGSPQDGTLPSPIFDSGLPPNTISVSACLIEWSIAGDTFASDPPRNASCLGNTTTITLIPLGVSSSLSLHIFFNLTAIISIQATKLRISEFPVFDASKVSRT